MEAERLRFSQGGWSCAEFRARKVRGRQRLHRELGNSRWNGDFPHSISPTQVQWGKGLIEPLGSLSHPPPPSPVTLPPPSPMAKVFVSCFLSINTGMFQLWALSLPGPGPPHSGWSCPGMGSGRTSVTIPSTHCLRPACPARWVTLGWLRNLSGSLKNKGPAKLGPGLGLRAPWVWASLTHLRGPGVSHALAADTLALS